MDRSKSHRPHGRGRVLLLALVLLTALATVEAYRVYRFYDDTSRGRDALTGLKDRLDLVSLESSAGEIEDERARLEAAAAPLRQARAFAKNDPLLVVASHLPVIGKQADGLRNLVFAAEASTRTGLAATEVAFAYAQQQDDPTKTSIEDGLTFLRSQEPAMTRVEAGVRELEGYSDHIEDGLWGPMANARRDLDQAVAKLRGLVDGYVRANTLLPEFLGYEGARRYLILPQNDTELFPSGGLISSYGIATFERGHLVSMNLEYFGTLYDRWQTQTREYVEPPRALKNYLKRDYSWGLGEAGWYPDFPTTVGYATGFVEKGGAGDTDGALAIDLRFVQQLLRVVGPVPVQEYGVTVTPENLYELSLEMTRDEIYVTGQPRKAFLSYLARAMLSRVFEAPKSQWLDMLQLLDRMGRERHLQLYFYDERLQEISIAYGLDGALREAAGDFLMLADTSVNSTKLNMILEPRATIDLQLSTAGSARTTVTYSTFNPFPRWQAGRDPRLVTALMFEGVYGSYLRLYADDQARLIDVRVDGTSAGAEQAEIELGKQVFGRFATVLPGATRVMQFLYETPDVVREDDGLQRYRLLVQKQAGTDAIPLDVRFALPDGARLEDVRLDGKQVMRNTITTDLRTDRLIEITYRLK